MSVHEEITAIIRGGGDTRDKADAILQRFFVAPQLTPEQHKAWHIQAHEKLDQLLADYLMQNKGRVPSSTTVLELMEWSYVQTQHPTGF